MTIFATRTSVLAFLFGNIFPLQFLFGQYGFENPSFEGVQGEGLTPPGWFVCDIGSTPDVLPGAWEVLAAPSEGNAYLGLITREDGTWESVGQRARQILRAKECYTFSVNLARSVTYAGFNLPVRLRVWGGYERCKKDELLADSGLINHGDWQKYSFEFYPKQNVRYLIFEAFYARGTTFPYRGNILIDKLSPLKSCFRASLY